MEFSLGSGGGCGGNDVELLSKTLQVEHMLFYFDMKENPRGRYLKISEKTSATRSTIIVPFNGIAWLIDILNYYVTFDDQRRDDFDDLLGDLGRIETVDLVKEKDSRSSRGLDDLSDFDEFFGGF
ncbi:putative purine-rich element binding protein family [Helianthus annuus]|nr:putative purine-rich element binding protein family [Helianthus annuus]